MKTIILISYGVGGSQALNPVYKRLQEKYIVYNIALTDFAQKHLDNSKLLTYSEVVNLIKSEQPDLVINERSNGVEVQNKITKYCNETDVNNIAILDFYGDYKRRFEEVPNYIIVPGKSVEEEMIQVGFDKGIIKVLGSPAFERLKQYKYKKVNSNVNPKVLFLSQPYREHKSEIDQVVILEEYQKELNKYYQGISIDVKLHPNENIETWDEYARENNIFILKHNPLEDTLQTCLNYDLLIGYNSTVMLQTLLIKIPTIFYNKEIGKYIRQFYNNEVITQYVKYSDFKLESLKECVQFIDNLMS